MPDFRDFLITRSGSVITSIPRYTISCNVLNSTTGEKIRDFNIKFPNILAHLSDEELDELFKELIMIVINKKLQNNID